MLKSNCKPKTRVEKVSNADMALVLWHAHPSRLQKLVYRPGSDYMCLALDELVLRAINRCTALTELYLDHLYLYEGSLQVDSTAPIPVLSTTTQRVNA